MGVLNLLYPAQTRYPYPTRWYSGSPGDVKLSEPDDTIMIVPTDSTSNIAVGTNPCNMSVGHVWYIAVSYKKNNQGFPFLELINLSNLMNVLHT